jgi:hypothetical protein
MNTMKQFTGTKTVKACPMTLGEAEKVLNRHIDISSVENRDLTPGYLVEYGDDGDNYRSWSPKEVFERAYRQSETDLDRMLIEKEDVSRRYLKGREFTFSQQFRKLLPEQAQVLLLKQLDALEQYLYHLSRRIELAGISEAKARETESMLESLIGMQVIDAFPGKCDTCPEEPTDCKKLQLTGGSYICLRQPCASKDYNPNLGDIPCP